MLSGLLPYLSGSHGKYLDKYCMFLGATRRIEERKVDTQKEMSCPSSV